MGWAEYVSTESCLLSRGLLLSDLKGEGICNVLVAGILEEVPI